MIKECVKSKNIKIQHVLTPKDLRVVKTKDALYNALLRLLEKQSLIDLSITQLCKEARVSRTVFYNYYATPEDVFEELFAIIMEKFDASVRKEKIDVKRVFDLYNNTVKSNSIVFSEIYSMSPAHPFVQYIYGIYFGYWKEAYPKEFDNVNDTYKRFVVYGHIGLMNEWLNDNSDATRDTLISIHNWFLTSVLKADDIFNIE